MTSTVGEDYAALQERAAQYLTLPTLAQLRRGYKRDPKGRFSSGGGTGGGKAPEQLQEDATIRATYGFHDPQTGLTAEVVHYEHSFPAGSTTTVQIQIKDRTGQVVGRATRELRPEQLEVHHSYLDLDEGVQGQGFATRYNEQVEQAYREHGIERITLTANSDVGGYAWARAGYDFASPYDRANIGNHAVQQALQHQQRWGPDALRQARELEQNPDATPLEFSMIGYTPGAATWPGKEIMLDSDWNGVKEL